MPDAEIYGRPKRGWAYVCGRWPECNAYVGTHPGTKKPLGTLADAELRWWRRHAHAALDALWKGGMMRRWEAYRVAAELLGMEPNDCHIGQFTAAQCRELIRALGGLRLTFKRVRRNTGS